MSDVLDLSTVEGIADLALALGVAVLYEGYIVIPDVVIVEEAANGHPLPDTWQGTRRIDGRTVRLYSLPEVPA